MDARGLIARRNQITYQVLTSIFAIASVLYVWVTIDWFLDYKASLGSSETVEVFGGEWPVSTIHAMAFSGWLMTAGPYAAGVLTTQLGSIWWFRPKRIWLAAGVVVSLTCSFAVLTWISNL
jgi:hypothetical protein